MSLKDELLHLLRSDAEVRDALRRESMPHESLLLPARLDGLTAQVEALAAAQLRTEERVEALAAAQLRTEERLEALTRGVDALVRAIEELAQTVRGLADWQRGEQGRREGERYERDTCHHAYVIFGGGRSATERPEDLERLRRAVDVAAAHAELGDTEDPFLADLLWLKGDRIAVVEVSRQVDVNDMDRANRRAGTLRSGGLPALAVVIGRDWASEEAERAVWNRGVEWRVGENASAGYQEFRREPAA